IFSSYTPNVKLSIYGKDIEYLSDKITDILIEKNCNTIHIYSPIAKNELLKKYIDADYCIFPTKAEAFSLAPMEAMAMSKVVLYTDQTSARELINDGDNGILIKSCTVENILIALEKTKDLSIHDYQSISKNAYNTVNLNFNIKEKNIENIKFYQEVIKNDD
ncbi:glycosyltransferase, partial [Providencia sp. wls1950]|uniref:glycosyltransferase n=1 Tax=Providencia sp. wls1950 TaxID=2675147 RepID=UPI0012B6694A